MLNIVKVKSKYRIMITSLSMVDGNEPANNRRH